MRNYANNVKTMQYNATHKIAVKKIFYRLLRKRFESAIMNSI